MFTFVQQTSLVSLLLLGVVLNPVFAADPTCGKDPNTARNKIKYSTYFYSKPQDAGQCSMRVVNGRIVGCGFDLKSRDGLPRYVLVETLRRRGHTRILEELGVGPRNLARSAMSEW